MEFKNTLLNEIIKNNYFTKQRAKKLIAIISLTDAACYFDKDGTARWILMTSPEIILHKFVFDLFKFGFNMELPTFYKTRNKIYKSTELDGKGYCFVLNNLFKFSSSFKKFPSRSTAQNKDSYLKEPQPSLDFIFNEPKWFKILCLRIAMSLEGSIITKFMVKRKRYKEKTYYQFQFEPVLELACTHPNLVNSWKKLFEEINLNMKEKYDKRSWKGLIGLRTSNKNSILKFVELGGFLFDLKINKSPPTALISNNRFSKQVILNTIIEILKKYPRSFHFKSKIEAKKFRIKFIQDIYIKTRKKNNGHARIRTGDLPVISFNSKSFGCSNQAKLRAREDDY